VAFPCPEESTMKICPIAIAVGCPKCPLFKVCPAKEALGGYKAPAEAKDGPGEKKSP
jgi:hypothetical protein